MYTLLLAGFHAKFSSFVQIVRFWPEIEYDLARLSEHSLIIKIEQNHLVTIQRQRLNCVCIHSFHKRIFVENS